MSVVKTKPVTHQFDYLGNSTSNCQNESNRLSTFDSRLNTALQVTKENSYCETYRVSFWNSLGALYTNHKIKFLSFLRKRNRRIYLTLRTELKEIKILRTSSILLRDHFVRKNRWDKITNNQTSWSHLEANPLRQRNWKLGGFTLKT